MLECKPGLVLQELKLLYKWKTYNCLVLLAQQKDQRSTESQKISEALFHAP